MAELPKSPGAAPPSPGAEPLLVNIQNARQTLGGISARLLWSLTKSGEIPCVRIGRRVMYDPQDLHSWRDSKKSKRGAS